VRVCVAVALLASLVGCRFDRGSAGPSDAGAADVGFDSPIQQGSLAVASYQCGECHQSPDPNDGVLSGQTAPVPGTHAYGSNLTPDPDTGMDAWEAGTIAAAILQSLDEDGGALCPAMPAFVDAGMQPDVALAIARYLQSLTPVWRPVPRSTCGPAASAGDGGG
jgi:hypothetical protein